MESIMIFDSTTASLICRLELSTVSMKIESALARCLEYAAEIKHQAGHTDAATVQARNRVLKAIDELEYSLNGAEPSERAKLLGLGW
jgi:DNA-binding LacI/PurR family transcriptional regulator